MLLIRSKRREGESTSPPSSRCLCKEEGEKRKMTLDHIKGSSHALPKSRSPPPAHSDPRSLTISLLCLMRHWERHQRRGAHLSSGRVWQGTVDNENGEFTPFLLRPVIHNGKTGRHRMRADTRQESRRAPPRLTTESFQSHPVTNLFSSLCLFASQTSGKEEWHTCVSIREHRPSFMHHPLCKGEKGQGDKDLRKSAK